MIDAHIHLFDPTRPQGIPWPGPADGEIYRPALPERLRSIAGPLGVNCAIAVECSPWPEDNEWLLEAAARDAFVAGVVGNLEPAEAGFRGRLEELRSNPLFLGIRYGNLWGRDLGAQLAKPEFVAGIKTLADLDLVLDTANPNARLIDDLLRLTDRVDGLRVVVDHLPRIEPPPALRELAARPNVYAKLSGVLRRVDGGVPLDAGFYRARLDELGELFGEERLVFGSDWPNSDLWGSYAEAFGVVRQWVARKGSEAAEKLFFGNAASIYRWNSRAAEVL